MTLSTEAAMSRKIQFICLFVLLGLLSLATQLGFAQSPLNFGNNFFVTGDYIVAGAYGMTTKFTTINGVSYAVGTISVPDNNLGITGTKQVPAGAQIVAALLYWQTVEKVGSPGSGQNGYFRPLLYSKSGGPAAPGYAISGTNVSGTTTVSWSSGGCGGGSTGKILRTYRADVAGGLPNDANGNPTPNGSFEVRLPSVGNSTPLTLGATLVVIYRIPSGAGGPSVPLNAIVIYDGDYAQSNTQLTMTQQLQGFYDADTNTVSRLTHIVGSGQSNKFQTVYLGKDTNTLTKLPSLYPKLPAFPGWYGPWDNPTWTFTSGSPLNDSSSATTQVVPSASNQGCVSWGAIILSTTVKNPDNDGILYSWKTNQGYCDASVNNGVCGGLGDPAWVPLPGAMHFNQDVFLQYDYMCSTISSGSCATGGSDYSFDPRLAVDTEDSPGPPHANAVDKVVAAYANHSVHLHAIAGNAILENQPNVLCTDSEKDASGNLTCPFPNELGTVGFRYGLENIKNYSIQTQTGRIGECTLGTANCVSVFQPGKKDSYHYALFSHGVGVPNWFLFDKSLSSVKQTGNTVTFTTPLPHGIKPIVGDTVCSSNGYMGRVTVLFAVTNPNLNGTFCIKNVNVAGTTFDITVPGSPTNFTYPANAEPYLGVADGQVTSMSGFSDVGGQNVVVALGYGGWGPANVPTSDGNKWQTKAGTLMHELGHNMGHTHGGTFYNNYKPLATPPVIDYTPTFEVNCKSNVQTSMSYMFQFDLLQVPGLFNAKGNPLMVVDYSEDSIAPTLTESQPQGPNLLTSSPYANTGSFQLTSFAGIVVTLSSVANASGGTTVYTGTITGGGGNAFVGRIFTVAGFTKGSNNGTFVATASTATTLTLSNISGVSETHAATARTASASVHCDGTPLLPTDQPMTYVPFSPSDFFWSNVTGEDIDFNGNTTDVMHAHNEWTGTPAGVDGVGLSPGVDLQQISAIGTLSTSGAGGGHLSGGGGGGHLSGGGGGGHLSGGGGGGHLSGGGGGGHLSGGGGAPAESTHEAANSYARPPRSLTIVQEEASPRYIDLSWFAPTFGTVTNYKIYRSVAGGAFIFLDSVPGTQTTYQDKTVTCNSGGYRYQVTAVTTNDAGVSQESTPSNTVPATGEPLLTGCYVVNNFSVPSSAVHGVSVPITWVLSDDLYITPPAPWAQAASGNPVNRPAGNTLVAIGPSSSDGCNTVTPNVRTNILLNGNVTAGGLSTLPLPITGGEFTFNLDTDAAPFCAGSYKFELDLDSGQKFTSSALQLSIDINDLDNPHINAVALPNTTVGAAYSDTLTEEGGTAPFTWTVTGLPAGISQQPPGSPTLSGTTCLAGSYPVPATVTDSKSNSGSQAFTLQVNKATTTTGVTSNANPSVFQQMVTFTVTVAPQYSCTPTGTVTLMDGVTQIGSKTLASGTATFTTSSLSVSVHNITATYSGDSNFTSSNSAVFAQTVNPAKTATSLSSLSPSPAFVGQPISVSYTFGVVLPGAGTPIAPSGNITVLASDGSSCTGPAAPSGGMCTLSPVPTAAGNVTFTISYPGDTNFVASGDNGNYTVYQLVFTNQPSNTGVGLSITPAVVVTAEDSSNSPLTTFTGGITVAIGIGPGTLTGTLTQNAVGGVATFGDLSINKIANGYKLTAAPSGGVPDATSNPFNIDTFYVDANGNFGTLDLPTGTVTQIGAATVPGSNGIDLTPVGQVYAYNTSNQLMQITPSTGVPTPVGGPGSIPDQATTGALTDGRYFGIDVVTGNLYSIDLPSGATTLVGPTSSALVPAGCSFEASLTGSANVLYYTIGSTGVGTGCTAFPDTLYQIDPTSGATTTIGQITISGSDVNAFVGSTFVSNTLYGLTADGKEYSIAPATGVATFLTNTTPAVPILGAGSSQ
jgi:Bacterial Ig-like domain (group 3)